MKSPVTAAPAKLAGFLYLCYSCVPKFLKLGQNFAKIWLEFSNIYCLLLRAGSNRVQYDKSHFYVSKCWFG